MVLPAIFWLTWFFLLQLPTAHIVTEQEAGYSERYVALATLAAAAVAGAVVRCIVHQRAREIFTAIALLLITGAGVTSYLRGQYYLTEKDFAQQWHDTDPQSTGALCGLGRVYEQAGQTNAAIAQYQLALKINPRTPTALNNLANIYLDQHRFVEAMRLLHGILENDLSNPVAMVNYAYALDVLAVQDHDPAKIQAAKIWLDKAVHLRPGYANAHLQLGLWQLVFGDKSAARQEFQTVLQLDPGNKTARAQLEHLPQ